ncbi:MAG: DUF2973 domain-containing protein [Leptolyngbya sp. SIO1D8]|nr:DUF2973 domain-containing protein [Leptolyngbya sp. SIO1D8]
MLHALYIIAFAVLATLAISNLIRNLVVLGTDTRQGQRSSFFGGDRSEPASRSTAHPEMLDETGRVVNEPLLVMRSISLEDARERLDALYEGSSNQSDGKSSEDDSSV